MRAAESKLALRATWLATRLLGSVSPRLVGPVVARLWFTPWRLPAGERALERQKAWLAGTEPVTFSTPHHRIAGYSAGTGPTVVLAHGWGETGASLGAFVEPLVAAGYRVVGIDWPGHGGSSGGQVDVFEVAAALRSVCDSLGEVHAVVAHSLGAMTTVQAVHASLGVERLVLIAPSARADHALDTFAKLFSLPPKAKEGLRATINRRYGSEVWERLSATILARDIDVPALIVHDRDDSQVALEDSEELHRAWRGSQLMTTETLGHGRILRDPKVIEAVVSFLDDAVAPGAQSASG